MAELEPHAKGPPQRAGEEGQGSAGETPKTGGTGGPRSGKLPPSTDIVHSGSSTVRSGVVVEGRRRGRNKGQRRKDTGSG